MTVPVHAYTPEIEFHEKLDRIKKLFAFHREMGGTKAGKRKAELQILNESAIVMLYAAWENYVEYECAFWATHIVVYVRAPSALPKSLKAIVAGSASISKSGLDNWIYAGEGWRRETLLSVAKEIHGNHQASPDRVDELIHKTVGLRSISKSWNWPAMSPDRAQKKLRSYISLRGALAHTAGNKSPVTLDQCEAFAAHLESLVKRMSQLLSEFAQVTLKIACNIANDAIVDELVTAMYKDIETWQLGQASDEVTLLLQQKSLI